jgi:hypothetical protein
MVSPASALRANNVAATRAYLQASYVYERSAQHWVEAMVDAIEARASELAKGCPSSLTYAPRDGAFGELGGEVGSSLWFAGTVPVRSMLLRLAGSIDRLTWSDRKLTGLVHAEATSEQMIVRLSTPNICAQIEAWRSSAYAVLSAEAEDYLKSLSIIESKSTVGPSEKPREVVIRRMLRRYEGPSERRLAERVEKLEERTEKHLDTVVLAAKRRLATVLGVTEL